MRAAAGPAIPRVRTRWQEANGRRCARRSASVDRVAPTRSRGDHRGRGDCVVVASSRRAAGSSCRSGWFRAGASMTRVSSGVDVRLDEPMARQRGEDQGLDTVGARSGRPKATVSLTIQEERQTVARASREVRVEVDSLSGTYVRTEVRRRLRRSRRSVRRVRRPCSRATSRSSRHAIRCLPCSSSSLPVHREHGGINRIGRRRAARRGARARAARPASPSRLRERRVAIR